VASCAAVALVVAPAAVLALAAAGFALGRSVAGWYPIAGVAVAALVVLATARADPAPAAPRPERAGAAARARCAAAGWLVAVALATLAIAAAGRWYDTSYDGLAYHQSAVAEIARGWNPWRSPAPPRAYHLGWLIEHFPKGPWVVEAALMRLAGRLEPAKGLNVALALGAGLATFAALRRFALPRWQRASLAACIAANPVAVCQSFSFCLDGQLASALTALAAFALLAVEMLFRMRRLWLGPRTPRDDAVSTG
jgi:hypothetical protein